MAEENVEIVQNIVLVDRRVQFWRLAKEFSGIRKVLLINYLLKGTAINGQYSIMQINEERIRDFFFSDSQQRFLRSM